MNKQAIGHGYSPPSAYSIAEFCADNRISRTHLHNLNKAGRGPRVMRVGRRVIISAEAAADWRREFEAQVEEVAA